MRTCEKDMEFEKAAEIRDTIQRLEKEALEKIY